MGSTSCTFVQRANSGDSEDDRKDFGCDPVASEHPQPTRVPCLRARAAHFADDFPSADGVQSEDDTSCTDSNSTSLPRKTLRHKSLKVNLGVKPKKVTSTPVSRAFQISKRRANHRPSSAQHASDGTVDMG